MVLIGLVDDNVQEREELKKCVEMYFSKKEEPCVIHQFSDGVEFIRSREKYDVVFLEMQVGEMDGVEVARFSRMVNKETQIVFVTHMKEMAIRGYEVNAVDFIVKPTEQDVINRVLDKVLERINTSANVTFALRTADGLHIISSKEIKFVEVYDHDLIYHTTEGEIVVRGNLGEVCKKLERYQFIQCSRSYLVNMRHIKSIHKSYVLVDGEQIQIAKSRQKDIEQHFINYLGMCI